MSQINLEPVKQPDRMASYWKREWKTIALVTITGMLFDGSMSYIPILQGQLVDAAVYTKPLSQVIRSAVMFLAAVAVIQIMRLLKRYYVRVFANKTSAAMRSMLYNNIIGRTLTELSKESAGDMMNKAVADVDLCVEGMRKVTTEVFDTGILMTGYLISMLYYDVKITLLSCIFLPLAMWIASRLKTVIVKYTKQARTQSSKVAQQTLSNIENALLYRIHGSDQTLCAQYEKELASLEEKSIRANVLENSMQPVYNAIAMLGVAQILYLGGGKVMNGTWTIGTFTAYLAIFSALAVKASKAAKLFNSYQKASVSWKRIKPYLGEYKEYQPAAKITAQKLELTVKNLSFSYPDSDKKLILDLSCHFHTGQIIGVTGPVASGKSTLGIALTGVYPYEGSISINQKELSSYTKEERSGAMSYMGHAPLLFSDTIYENITLGVPGDITKVLSDVCFDQDIAQMPDGIMTKVGSGGVRLSGGQQARIALARALYHPGRIVILDDPFSAVDMKTEAAIIASLKANYSDRLFLIISHRLAIFPDTDAVLFLKDSQNAVCDSHEHLIEASEEYRSIYELQKGEGEHENA